MSYRDKIAIFFSILFFISGCGYNSRYTINNSKSMHKATMRPYNVGGRVYYPTVVRVGSSYRGIASWYGDNFHGNSTSNGEYYNMYSYTAAHKTLPMNTMVKVTNLKNNRSVIVRINDRGPFVANRIIDLSYAAAKKLNMIGSGTAPVKVTVLGFNAKLTPQGGFKKSTVKKVTLNRFAVQIGAFRNIKGAYIYKEKYDHYANRYKSIIKKFLYDTKPLYRVWLKGFKSEKEARDFIARNNFQGSFIIRE